MADSGTCDLSIILPTYNYARFIGAALNSILEQIPASVDAEIIVVDDGSTDDTEAAVRAAARDPRVRYVHQENAGPAGARNRGLGESRGRYLMLMDADDSLRPGCIETTVSFLDRYPEVGLFFTNYDIYDEGGVTAASGVDIWRSFRSLPHREPAPGEWIFDESLAAPILRAGAFMHTSGLTIRREVLDRVGPFQEGYSYGEDDEFYARAAWATTAGYVDRVLSRKRSHPDSLIHAPSNRVRNARHALELAEIQRDYFREEPRLGEILHAKIRGLATAWCWGLVSVGRRPEARAVARRYQARYPGYWGFYWLWIRSWLPSRD